MFRKAFAFLLVGLLAALVLALPVLYTSAQENTATVDPLEIELIGMVDSFDGVTLTVGGFSFDVTGVEIDSPLTAGSHVELTITLSDTGEWVVTEVQVDDESVDDNIDAGNDDDQGDDNSDVGNEDNADADNDDYGNEDNDDAGSDDDGNDDNDDFGNDDDDDDEDDEDDEDTRIIGTLEALGDGFIIVGGQTIVTTGAEIEDSLFVGSLVEVEVVFSNGQLVASEVKFSDTDGTNSGSGNVDLPGDCTVPSGWTTYVIQSGDSLSSIAARSDTSVSDLTEANCITISTIIHPGDVIAVPRTPDPRPVGDNEDSGNEDNDDSGNDDDGNDENADDGNDDIDDDDNSGPGGGNNDDEDNDDGNDDNGSDDDGNDDNDDGNDDDGNDDNDDDGNDDSNDDDGNDDDNSGSGSDDDDDDDNSGSGGDDDSDDN